MPKCFMLVGVPGSGKSTWIENQDWANDCDIISTDIYVEIEALHQGKTYSEVFEEYMPIAIEMMTQDVEHARLAGRDIIWDQTSTTIASRRRKFRMLPEYTHIAVVFKTPEPEELSRRLNSRSGKTIPDHVIMRMIDGFVMPTEDEGFAEIWYAE